MGILLSKFRFNFNAVQILISCLHGDLCHIWFGDLWSFMIISCSVNDVYLFVNNVFKIHDCVDIHAMQS